MRGAQSGLPPQSAAGAAGREREARTGAAVAGKDQRIVHVGMFRGSKDSHTKLFLSLIRLAASRAALNL